MVNFNYSGRMIKKIKEDTSGLVQDITKWVLGFLKRESRLPTKETVIYAYTHTFGYSESPLLEQLVKRAINNVMSMPFYKQVKNKQKQSKQ